MGHTRGPFTIKWDEQEEWWEVRKHGNSPNLIAKFDTQADAHLFAKAGEREALLTELVEAGSRLSHIAMVISREPEYVEFQIALTKAEKEVGGGES